MKNGIRKSRSIRVRTLPSSSVSHAAPTKSAGGSGTSVAISGTVRAVTDVGDCSIRNQ